MLKTKRENTREEQEDKFTLALTSLTQVCDCISEQVQEMKILSPFIYMKGEGD